MNVNILLLLESQVTGKVFLQSPTFRSTSSGGFSSSYQNTEKNGKKNSAFRGHIDSQFSGSSGDGTPIDSSLEELVFGSGGPGSGVPASGSGGGNGGVLMVTDGSVARLVALLPYSNYSVTVAAATAVGVGVASEDILCTTLQDGKIGTNIACICTINIIFQHINIMYGIHMPNFLCTINIIFQHINIMYGIHMFLCTINIIFQHINIMYGIHMPYFFCLLFNSWTASK